MVLLGALPLMYPAALSPLRLRYAQTGTGGSPEGSLIVKVLCFCELKVARANLWPGP